MEYTQNEREIVRPNIFSYATSELSQDAMFAWLVQWADDKYKTLDNPLNQVAKAFVRLLIGKPENYPIHSINVGRQWKNIDIWVEINDDSFLVIEDKTYTKIHDDQLDRYKKTAEEEYKGSRPNLFFAYVKTGNEPKATLKCIGGVGYHAVTRRDILDCLCLYTGKNEILFDFTNHLKQIEIETQNWMMLPVDQWGRYAWEGFYMELEHRFDRLEWGYVSNPTGGFLGAWWHFVETDDVQMYLQFEESKLCFKICYEGEEDRTDVRWKYHSKLMERAKERYPEILRPNRFGSGMWMTIAIVSPDDVFGKSTIDIDKIDDQLKEYQKLIDECCQ